MKRTLIILYILASALQVSAEALSIDSCRALALQYNKDRQSAALTTKQAEYTRKSTYAMFFPDLSLQGAGMYSTGNGGLSIDLGSMLAPTLANLATMASAYGISLPNVSLPSYDLDYKVGWVYGAGVMLKQPIYMGGKIRAGYSMAKTAVEMARENERLTDAQVIQQTDEAYAQVVKAEELKRVAESYKSLLEELDRNVESAVRHGLRMDNDRMKVQVKLNEVELQLRRADNGVRLAKMNLSHCIGSPLGGDIEVLSEYPEVDDAMALQTTDVSQRPEVALLDYQTQLAEQKVKIARSEMLPQVALLAKYGYTHGVEFNDRTLLEGWSFAGGVTVSVPIYHFGEHTNKVKAAKLKQQQMQLERDNKAEMMLLELTQAANKLDEARLEKELTEKSLAQAEKSMQLSRQQYDAGFETLGDCLESQAQWQQAYQQSVDASFQLYLASVAYMKAAGTLVP